MPGVSIRFVGGPWHNRIETIELSPEVVVQRRGQQQTTLSAAGCFAHAKFIRDRYLLAHYFTEWGTHYRQYVHWSLVRGKRADPSTFRERFPVWRIDRRQMDARLRRAMKK